MEDDISLSPHRTRQTLLGDIVEHTGDHIGLVECTCWHADWVRSGEKPRLRACHERVAPRQCVRSAQIWRRRHDSAAPSV
eukprot:scaffold132924_cov51-Phaeocystis_antarctica.AAC.1